ncbi:tRNA (adenosine(37)-N6)-threonylcarbamoyltransferase complex dimerization subunit type 1 TsaB [Bacillus luteolus]|uniref:tRNA (Adenosine(37)-N6)-threonylcarbamoyltransferase complex dimerization subunit type 1 TsaB n=1 Tax=Litchfieldia luteola TaxID=682179 RepID=A0ABR9QDN8_9BACI|nr:tRNA (adenosine(37)-N6)-threonylcarbamoyltransferase complex dimerization subunit type 1 TsaB [Cytobacillus luteolus]MBE4906541.1 tRNA (adenosine(37)-N6)-threonylcarbamoyltransferase complex dimerization subunit type 1 TsaB [Cytobacillus luteolus]MBP1944587.1 tRNA threonylcarbamoyladenosine biosynthesis protein TsaB [Cytobacillus luteolus]
MKVLAIDTSNYVMGIAIVDGADVVGEVITNLKKNHSIRVMPAIHQLLQECDIKPSEVEKIVVAHGPGSYTGVRIGVTIAKTLAWALKIPLVGVSSLEVLAANGQYFQGSLSPIFDARRGQVYTGLYAYEEGQFVSKKNDRIVLLKDWLKELKEENQKVLFLGNDLAIHKTTIQEELEDLAIFASSSLNNPRPSELALLGVTREEQDVHSFVPNYIRMVEAETNWLASQNK